MGADITFGVWLKRHRRQLDLTQKALAYQAGCSVGTIRKIESDERRPSRQLATLLAQHLDIPSEQVEAFIAFARSEAYPLEVSFPTLSDPVGETLPIPNVTHQPEPLSPERQLPKHNLSAETTSFVGKNLTPVDSVSPLRAYHQQIVTMLSAARYPMDSRFVRLTLMLDQGIEAAELRFGQDSRPHTYDNLGRLLAEINEPALVLLGRPGSGKTTLLRHLQLEQARARLETGEGRIPFFVPLNSYRRLRPDIPVPDPADWLAQEWHKQHPELPELPPMLRQGRLLLLLDGLNEMPHRDKQDYRQRIGRWRHFLQTVNPVGNQVVFSCRSLDFSAPLGSPNVAVRQVRVEPLSPTQIEAFLTTYLPGKGADIWHTIGQGTKRVQLWETGAGDEQAIGQQTGQMMLFSNPFFLRLLVEQIRQDGNIQAGQASLLTGFVRRALYREIEQQEKRLFQPDYLLSEGDYEQVLHQAWSTPYELPWEGILFTQLEQLAFGMQDGRLNTEAGQVSIQEQEALRLLDKTQARDILQAGIKLNVLDKEVAAREVTFSHQLIQEYFTGRRLAKRPEPQRVAVPWRADEMEPSLADTIAGLAASEPLPVVPTTGWEEATMLAAAMARDQDQFVRELMPANLPLAARCAATSEVHLDPQLVAEIQQSLLSRIEEPHTELRARIIAAEALGELGDPRFERRQGLHGPYLRPPLVTIPAGLYPIGNDGFQISPDDPYGHFFASASPAHTVEIAAFEMAIFPVTNAEYNLFVEAEGYEEVRWWRTAAAQAWLQGEGNRDGLKQGHLDMRERLQGLSEESVKEIADPNLFPNQYAYWLWIRNATTEEVERYLEEKFPPGEQYHQPLYWEDNRFNHPSRPVVGICWFEAMAYCAWLSAQTDDIYTLPTEVEWEAVARGKEGRSYAYGDTFDPACSNNPDTHIRRTTPVGVFPGGRTPEGIDDLTGNVLELTTTLWGTKFVTSDYPYPYSPTDGRENKEAGLARRGVRGSGWISGRDMYHSSTRCNWLPNDVGPNLGFRMVRRSPSEAP